MFEKYFEYRDGKLFWLLAIGKRFAGRRAGNLKADGYRQIQLKGRAYAEHQIVWAIHNGSYAPDKTIDHINLDKADNRIENLRLATRSQQQINMRPTSRNRSGMRGVSWKKGRNRWLVSVCKDGICYHGGYFKYLNEANEKCLELRKRLYGDFA